MLQLEGYRDLEVIYDGGKSQVFRATRDEDGAPVVLKLLKAERPSMEERTRYHHEYLLASSHAMEQVVRAHAMHPYGQSLVICFDDIGGDALRYCFQGGPPDVASLLRLSIQIADALGELHRASLIHKDINPANIVWNRATGALRLIDLGISTRLKRQTLDNQDAHRFEGTLAYMAPEQTGRMNRSVDRRTDLYALGVTLYELATGTVPFARGDTLETFHAHLALQPEPPSARNSALPEAFDKIVLKLMSKAAEDRYQTAWGLKADLERCLERWERDGAVADFPLGADDIESTLRIPERLYGRGQETQRLLASFDDVSRGASKMLLVAGHPGIGKSALIREIHKPITARRGVFLQGKVDQYNRGVAYSVLTQALEGLAPRLLGQPADDLEAWRVRVRRAVGRNGQIICDLAPALAPILGEQPALQPLGGMERQNRFDQTVRRFFGAIATPEAPLVCFLDDLQWADAATLNLLATLLGDETSQHLLLIGAYRDNEIDDAHPLRHALTTMSEGSAAVETITLAPLRGLDIASLLSDTLRAEAGEVERLAAFVEQQTGGNPFFVGQYLQSLEQEALLRFDAEAIAWRWDDDEVEARGLTSGVVALMVERLGRLPEATQAVLQRASCVGDTFDFTTLAELMSVPLSTVSERLWPALMEGYVQPLGDGRLRANAELEHATQLVGRFAHDRVQQASYRQLDDATRGEVHLALGRYFAEAGAASGDEGWLFETVGHYGKALDLITDPAERLRVARLHAAAAERARLSTAYDTASVFLQRACVLLGDEAWSAQPGLAFEVHLKRAEVAYLNSEFESADGLYEAMLQRVETSREKVAIGRVQNDQYLLQGRYREAIEVQRACLAWLGMPLPEGDDALQEALDGALERLPELLGDRTIASLIDAPTMTDEGHVSAVHLLYGMFLSAYLSGEPVLPFLAMVQMASLSLEHGNCELSSYSYVGLGMMLTLLREEFDTAHAYASMGVALCERFDDLSTRCKTNFLFAADVHSWTQPLHNSRAYYDRAYQTAMDCGDWLTVGYMLMQSGSDRLTSGEALPELERFYGGQLPFLQRTGNTDAIELVRAGSYQPALHLLGRTEGWDSFDSEGFSEAEYEAKHADNPFYLAWLYSGRIRAAFLTRQRSTWPLWLERVKVVEQYVPSHSKVPECCFYGALMAHALAADATDEDARAEYTAEAARLTGRLEVWAEACPTNIAHRLLLVRAEAARLRGAPNEANRLYEEAVAAAVDAGFLNNEALSYELYGRHALSEGLRIVAERLLWEAAYRYRRWGAAAKVAALEDEFAWLKVSTTATRGETHTRHKTTTATQSDALLDVASLVQASQTLSQEIHLEALLEKLMRLAVSNAGAQRGVLLLADPDDNARWTVEAALEDDLFHLASLPLDSSAARGMLVPGVVRMMQQSAKAVRLDNAMEGGDFMQDPLVQARGLRSVLCLPLRGHGQLRGAIYLENSLTQGAFTARHVALLEHLATQVVISLTNARQYEELKIYQEDLQGLVDQRTRALTTTLDTLRRTQDEVLQAKVDAERSQSEAERQREAAETANEAKSEFLSNMSHELRTPLNAILGYAQLLNNDDALSVKHRRAVATIKQSGEHLKALMEDLLNLSAIEAGHFTLTAEIVELSPFLDKITALVQDGLRSKRLRFVREFSGPLPSAIVIDERRFTQVLLNLLSNATKFTSKGCVTLRLTCLEPHRPGNLVTTLRFEVEDTGSGIEMEDLRRIFARFERLDSAKRVQGTGLGLAISQHIVSAMGSRLNVRSAVGEGSTFWFDVRVEVPPTERHGRLESTTPTELLTLSSGSPAVLLTPPPDETLTKLREMAQRGRIGALLRLLETESEDASIPRDFAAALQTKCRTFDRHAILEFLAPYGSPDDEA